MRFKSDKDILARVVLKLYLRKHAPSQPSMDGFKETPGGRDRVHWRELPDAL